MNIGEELDKLAAEGRIGSVTLTRVGGLWQVYIYLTRTDNYVARRETTPGAALTAALTILPDCEAHDLRFGVTRINQPKPVEPAGIFD